MRKVRWPYQVRGFLAGALNLFLPSSCAACGVSLTPGVARGEIPRLCASCWAEISILHPPFCPKCGRPFGSEAALSDSPEHRCGDCRLREPHFDAARAVGAYKGALRETIHTYKYGNVSALGASLGGLLADRFGEHFGKDAIDLVTHVPLSPQRWRERGFDQAWLLARGLARRSGLRARAYVLDRIRWGGPQTELKEEARWRNVRGAFVLKAPSLVQSKRILVVDDVLTTGATASEYAKVLKGGGAEAVYVYALARTT